VAARSKACICGCPFVWIAGSNLADGHAYPSLVNVVCCAGRDFCVGPIPRPRKSCRVCMCR
jgi:hypothetical protein